MCIGDGDCTHMAGNPRCVAGTCRACTVATETTDCGLDSCNPVTNTCTGTRRGSRTTCLTCVTDSECGAGLTCGAVNPARGVTGNYCLPIRTSTCSRPYVEGINGDITDLGAMVNYCRSRTTTCEAVLHHSTDQGSGTPRCGNTPDGTSDDACGAGAVADGVCRMSTGGLYLCTYGCMGPGALDCPGVTTCVGDGTVPVFGAYCSI